jgi:glucose-1-phosphate cytidylyltransferase
MIVVLLAGGYGTRSSELTGEVPKPIVLIGELTILMHIMTLYAKYEYHNFIISTRYKSDYVKQFFQICL